MRSFVALFRTPTKGVSIDPNATEGAVVGENLYIREADGSLSLFQPTAGTKTDANGVTTSVVLSSGSSVTASPAAGGSNSGYQQDISPAAAPTNFDLDLSMISGLGQVAFPTLNYILIGDGTQWVAKPMSGDASIVASGAITVNTASKLRTARTIAATGDASWTVSFDGSG